MSESQTPTREVARRVFAAEFNDATYTFKESDDERAPLYALLPTGERVNRVFIVGTLTETEDIGNENEYWRGRVVDPTGTFFVYAGQYQPEA
ncbi:MAG: DNA-binding protein, partial [Halanaeroarchaeum sp.]